MNNNFNDRIFHLRIADIIYKLPYLKEFIKFLSENGFNTLYIEFATNFPYRSIPCLKKDSKYSEKDIKELCSFISSLGMKTIINGLSFSHSSNFLKYDEMKEYAEEKGSDNIDLLEKKSVDLMIRQGEDILALWPGLDTLHIGGDEIFGLGNGVKANSYILKYGKSRLYVEFVNKIVRHFAKKKIKVAVWSDMIIRYYQDINLLDKRTVIFYWDYWSYGKRIPFMTIGGGCPDTFVLDRKSLKGDLEKLYRWKLVREGDEIPVGHLEHFKKYIQLSPDKKSSKAFPYLKWFRENGFETICSFLSYTEKGSIYPNLGEKIEHIKGFLGEGKLCGSSGYNFCLWQPCWPLLELYKVSIKSIKFIAADPGISENKLFSLLEKDCSCCGLSAKTIREIFFCMSHFEFADVMNPFWGQTSCASRIELMKKAGWEKDEMSRVNHVIDATQKLLKNREFAGKDNFLRFTIKEINWRARCQKECMKTAKSAKILTSLSKEGKILADKYRKWIDNYVTGESASLLVKTRWDSIFEALKV